MDLIKRLEMLLTLCEQYNLSSGDTEMPAWLLALIPVLLPLLKSLIDKERKAAAGGRDGLVSIILNEFEKSGTINESTMKAAAAEYVRCCA